MASPLRKAINMKRGYPSSFLLRFLLKGSNVYKGLICMTFCCLLSPQALNGRWGEKGWSKKGEVEFGTSDGDTQTGKRERALNHRSFPLLPFSFNLKPYTLYLKPFFTEYRMPKAERLSVYSPSTFYLKPLMGTRPSIRFLQILSRV